MNNRTIGSVGVFVVTLLLASSAATALAQGRGRGQSKPDESQAKEAKEAKEAKQAKAKVVHHPEFGAHDREIIRNYYAKHGLPPGLAKRHGDLPPGLEKHLQRNGTLPPGLQKKLRPLPSALQHELGPLPRGYRRGILDRHLVVYRPDTYVVADSYLNAVR